MGTEETQISDENITMLMGMGFSDIEDIRKALRLAKNDINEAVAILTGEDSRGNFIFHILCTMVVLKKLLVLSIMIIFHTSRLKFNAH